MRGSDLRARRRNPVWRIPGTDLSNAQYAGRAPDSALHLFRNFPGGQYRFNGRITDTDAYSNSDCDSDSNSNSDTNTDSDADADADA